MKKKIFSSMLLLAMVITTVGMFVSCKDYDDDINDLRNQISTNATDLQSLVTEQINTVNSQITSLQTQASNLQAAYEAADANLKSTLEVVITESISTSEAYADIQAAQAQSAAIAAAQEMVASAIATLQAALDEANANIAANGESIATLVAANTELTSAIQAAQAKADQAYDLAQTALDLAQQAYDLAQTKADASDLASKADQADLDELSQNVSDLSEIVDEIYEFCAYDVQEAIYELMYEIYEVEYEAYINAAAIESLQAQLGDLSESDMTVLEMIQELESSLNATNDGLVERCAIIQSQVNDNATAIAAQQEDIDQLKKDVDAAVVAAEQYAETLTKQVADDLAEEVDGIYISLDKLTDAYQTADKALQGQIDQLKSDLQEKITTLNSELKDAIGDAADDLQSQIDDINEALNLLTNVDDFSALANIVTAQGESIEDLQAQLVTLNQYLGNANKRLKGLVFAPTTYVNGIEAIMFTTLEYQAWTNTEADAPASNATKYIIDDANHSEEYLVNPKNVSMSGIKDLTYISNTATNYDTRSVNTDPTKAPITVASSEIEDGVLKVTLAKNQSTSFGTSDNNFTLVSLKATIDDSMLTEDEIAEGEEVAVYSDWARLYETSVTPYIHSTIVGMGELQNGNLTESGDAHYWSYSTMYGGGTKASKLDSSNDGLYVAKEVVYTETLDLTTLVEVCDKDGNTYDMEKFNLGWEFNIMPYLLLNENEATDATDQANFAKIEGTTIYSTARDNSTTLNRDAIGRQPVVQVILRDLTNNQIVDVRYFKIKWVDENQEPVVSDFGELGNFTADYVCEGTIDVNVLEEMMNKLYTEENMTRDEFHSAYTLNGGLYATKSAAESAGTADAKLGEITDLADAGGAGQTHNIQWEIDLTTNPASQDEYNAGYKTITAYGYFQSNSNANSRIVFSVTIKLNITQMAKNSDINKFETQWDTKGARNINPQLESDGTYGNSNYASPGYETTMILGELLAGYTNNGATPGSIDELVNYGTALFVFDDDKLGDVATATGTNKSDWSVSTDGLTLYYNKVEAARIDDNGQIQLYESGLDDDTEGSATSTPSDGAKLLVDNYVPVKLVDESCDWTQEIDYYKYNVNFLKPLEFASEESDMELTDITPGSATQKAMGNLIIQEAYTSTHRVVYVYSNSSSSDIPTAVAGLADWYGVGTPEFGEPMTNMQTNGKIGSTCDTKLSAFTDADGNALYTIEVHEDDWTVSFTNKSGNAVGQDFKVMIPITISTKWQDGMTAYIVVTIKSNL